MFSNFLNKKNLIKIVSAMVIISIPTFVFFRTKTYPERIILNNAVINVEVADNEVLMAKGLSGHVPLSDTQGMLFIFAGEGKHDFWMKDMTFPLDIIWFDSQRKVIHIERGLSPNTFPKTYTSDGPSLYVLEVNSGVADKIGTKIGDQFSFVKSTNRKLGL